MKPLQILLLASLVVFSACAKKSSVQGTGANTAANQLIESRNYSFKANTAIPARGRTIQLNSDYSLIVKKDSIVAWLPYFGRAYTAMIGQTNGGIEFTSTKFDYKPNRKSNGSYEIVIEPHDKHDVQRMTLSLSPAGYGSLFVVSQNRESITFNGRIEQIENRR